MSRNKAALASERSLLRMFMKRFGKPYLFLAKPLILEGIVRPAKTPHSTNAGCSAPILPTNASPPHTKANAANARVTDTSTFQGQSVLDSHGEVR